mmetsp:Transcript_14848/g.46758  ORF Transcript_14848/g.46758 Transcript_14848/m.46758 type:complete len:206 (-) Transcript_14848:2242-2859(-)
MGGWDPMLPSWPPGCACRAFRPPRDCRASSATLRRRQGTARCWDESDPTSSRHLPRRGKARAQRPGAFPSPGAALRGARDSARCLGALAPTSPPCLPRRREATLLPPGASLPPARVPRGLRASGGSRGGSAPGPLPSPPWLAARGAPPQAASQRTSAVMPGCSRWSARWGPEAPASPRSPRSPEAAHLRARVPSWPPPASCRAET